MKKKNSVLVNNKIKKFNKKVQIPGDKSCSIRAILLASQCIGISKIKNLLESEDVLNCINTLKISLGVKKCSYFFKRFNDPSKITIVH